MQWTAEQQEVIGARGCNLVVSAAAGSGKTAVLVERICDLIARDGADIGRMLVATFTRAAAAEMKSRIAARLGRAVAEGGPEARRLGGQLLKLDRAQIGTLHSFCGELLRQYYHIAGIEPSFKTEDESVTQGLYDEALEETVDEFFEQGDADFMALAACWGGRDGDGLAALARRAYDAARNQPHPLDWLANAAGRFEFTAVEETPWFGELFRSLEEDIALAAECAGEAFRVASLPAGPAAYAACIEAEAEALERLARLAGERNLGALRAALAGGEAFGRLPALRGAGEETRALAKRVKKLRDEAKGFLKRAAENPLAEGTEEAAKRTRAMLPQMRALCRLVGAFDARYSAAKRYENVLDFSDLEHMALAVLDDPDAREETQGFFDYVFVDEYQDISPIQDELLRRVARPGAFFCVGDVKQSIYRFRSAEPEIFMRRLAGASAGERRIDLNRNFRSAARVVRLANCVFSAVMTRRLGGVDYGERERLEQAAPQPPVAIRDAPCELILIDNAGRQEEELTRLEELIRIEREAAVVARKIRELVGFTVWDGKAGAFRKLKYSDVTVLLRTVTGVAAEYADVFRRAGIPVYAEAEGGFAGELEVQLLMNLLRLVDNGQRDYELITSLHSALGGFSLEDLTEIRGLYPDGSFAEGAARYAAEGGTEPAERLRAFLDRLALWREASRHMSLEALVFRLCGDTGFTEYLGTLPGGERRQANVIRLAALARGFSGSLYDFIRNFDRLAGSAGRGRAAGQPGGAVTIMSVHKSKGLEFPVVILSNIGKNFNLQDVSADMLFHGELGLGPRYYNAARRTRADTLARAALAARARRDTLSEEMRLLYVAATRARERLIAVGTVGDVSGRLARWQLPLTAAGLSARARCWADWLGPVALRTARGRAVLAPGLDDMGLLPDAPDDWQVTVLDAASVKSLRPEPTDRASALKNLLSEAERAEIPPELSQALGWKYPWGDVAALPAKVSATSLLDRERNWRGPIPAPEIRRLPRFMEEKKAFSATDLGTFAHTALQLLPVDTLPLDIPGRLEDLERRGLIPEGAAAAVDTHWLERFFTSPIAARIRRSPRVQRELPFNLAVPVHQVFPGETGGDDILIQGIIDCCFIESERWVLVDYKTNRVDGLHTEKSIAEHYRPQLQTYRSALELITGIEVKEAWLYLLAVGKAVRVKI